VNRLDVRDTPDNRALMGYLTWRLTNRCEPFELVTREGGLVLRTSICPDNLAVLIADRKTTWED